MQVFFSGIDRSLISEVDTEEVGEKETLRFFLIPTSSKEVYSLLFAVFFFFSKKDLCGTVLELTMCTLIKVLNSL